MEMVTRWGQYRSVSIGVPHHASKAAQRGSAWFHMLLTGLKLEDVIAIFGRTRRVSRPLFNTMLTSSHPLQKRATQMCVLMDTDTFQLLKSALTPPNIFFQQTSKIGLLHTDRTTVHFPVVASTTSIQLILLVIWFTLPRV
jgi:hypothetical protein